MAEVLSDPPHTVTGQIKHRAGMWQQRREHRPVRRLLRVLWEGGLDHGGSGLPPRLAQVGGHLVGSNRLH
jgi:hypothetical protein